MSTIFFNPGVAQNLQSYDDAEAALKAINKIYNVSIKSIAQTFSNFSDNKEYFSYVRPHYPYLGIVIEAENLNPVFRQSYGSVAEPGAYGATLTRPDIFQSYYLEQLNLLIKQHKVPVMVGVSDTPIPLPFVCDPLDKNLSTEQILKMRQVFTMPSLARLDDDIPNCTNSLTNIKPLSIFSAERVDYSLLRLLHYTGTDPIHFQGFVLLTNYQRYVEEFLDYALFALKQNGDYQELILPGNIVVKSGGSIPQIQLPQMPAYHLKRQDGSGVTLINIGVGPSNAKTITDHLSVLRSHCWIMLGHCAGLRSSQILGDYVLAHGYVRDDHVLDDDLPPWIPVPTIAEIQVALQQACAEILTASEGTIGEIRTGTVFTTDNRNWELMSKELYRKFRQSRAIAVDMESATIAANGFRFRVPYGVLLCVSDKPIHGELKLQKMANRFYQNRIKQHLRIGLRAIELIRENGTDQLHSRKLRGFDDAPFR